MIHETILAIIIVFATSALLRLIIIPFLHKLKFGQQVGEDGPQAHLRGQGTPTVGGLAIPCSIIIASIFYIPNYPKVIPILLMTAGFDVIGFLNSYIKIVMERPEGLKLMQKLVRQFIITSISTWYLLNSGKVGTDMLIPSAGGFGGEKFLSLGISFIPTSFFIILGMDNGVNFTDGLDGLCISVTTLIATFLTIVAIGENMGVSSTTGAVVKGLLGLPLFNVYPAKVFMGDASSPALGGFVAAFAYMIHMPLFIPITGLIYLVEMSSVIIQVTYFKRTGGKRIFKMAPIHHRFRLCGWSETRIVAVFAIVTAILCMVAYLEL